MSNEEGEKFSVTDKWIFPCQWIRFLEEGMQRWLAWPTFLHSSASSSSWEDWRYGIWREFSHAWPATTTAKKWLHSSSKRGWVESQHAKVKNGPLAPLFHLYTLHLHSPRGPISLVCGFFLSPFRLVKFRPSRCFCCVHSWMKRCIKYLVRLAYNSTVFPLIPPSYPRAPVTDWDTAGRHP